MGECACVPVRQDRSMFSTAGRIGIGKRPCRPGNCQFPQNRLVVRRRTGRCAEDDSVCGSAKGRVWAQILSGLKRLRRSSGFRAKSAKGVPQGLKPAFILRPFRHATQRVPRSCPFKAASFSAAWKARPEARVHFPGICGTTPRP